MSERYKRGVRIIGGRWKGTSIAVPAITGLRPTPDRIRETLFNWLQPRIAGARCLDLFAGSGALAIEALSRGAGLVTALDCQRRAAQAIAAVGARLGAEGLDIRVVRAEEFLQAHGAREYDIVFMDPPFELKLHRTISRLLEEYGWLSADALIYVEAPVVETMDTPENWIELKRKRAGNVAYALYHRRDG